MIVVYRNHTALPPLESTRQSSTLFPPQRMPRTYLQVNHTTDGGTSGYLSDHIGQVCETTDHSLGEQTFESTFSSSRADEKIIGRKKWAQESCSSGAVNGSNHSLEYLPQIHESRSSSMPPPRWVAARNPSAFVQNELTPGLTCANSVTLYYARNNAHKFIIVLKKAKNKW